jgi:nucleotide-binding universal stress UspA family protein
VVKSMLIGLDGSPFSHAAVELGISWAKQMDAMLVGIGIVDEPAVVSPIPNPVVPGLPPLDPMAQQFRLDQQILKEEHRRVERYLQQFTLQCAEQQVACKVLEDLGVAVERLSTQVERFDLMILGRRTFFHRGSSEDLDATLKEVARYSPRPVVTVPNSIRESKCVMVAYDGSAQAARALQAFESSGLCKEKKVHIVSIAESHAEAERHAQRAADFLTWHERPFMVHAIASTDHAAQTIIKQTWACDPSILIMGVYGHGRISDYLFGSVTRTLLKESPVPLFLFH